MNAIPRSAPRFEPAIHSIDARHHVRQVRLADFNARRLKPALPSEQWRDELESQRRLQLDEGEFIESERAAVSHLVAGIPTDPDAFMAWFEGLRETGAGQHDRLFPWLAEYADVDAMRWFLTQEVGGEAGFDDLVALTQVRMPTRAKLELAANYWDEMGRGHEKGMHGPMLSRAAAELDVVCTNENSLWESLALANVMAGLAANRRYAYQAVGALGVIEMTAPGRVSLVNAGLRRLNVSPTGRQYFQLHAGLDIRHSEAWNREVIRPLVDTQPETAKAIGEGALLRLRCGARCFERYRRELGVA